jgi:hypothetical protein
VVWPWRSAEYEGDDTYRRKDLANSMDVDATWPCAQPTMYHVRSIDVDATWSSISLKIHGGQIDVYS